MLQLSSQVTTNLAAQVGRLPSYGVNTSNSLYLINWGLCIILVKDTVAVPTSHSGVIAYINSAINGSSFHGGAAGNDQNCLAIISGVKSCSYAAPNCITFDGAVSFTPKNTGTVGGAIFTYLAKLNAQSDPALNYPLTQATTQSNADFYVGNTEASIYNYLLITDSIGLTSASNVILDTTDLVSGTECLFYGASLKFSNLE